jgi:hypothetical protein
MSSRQRDLEVVLSLRPECLYIAYVSESSFNESATHISLVVKGHVLVGKGLRLLVISTITTSNPSTKASNCDLQTGF